MRLRRTTVTGSPGASVPVLIGVDDLRIPWWAQAAETVASSGSGRMLREAPVALAVIVRLANVWHADQIIVLHHGRSLSTAPTRS